MLDCLKLIVSEELAVTLRDRTAESEIGNYIFLENQDLCASTVVFSFLVSSIFNKPGVAKAVLQTVYS